MSATIDVAELKAGISLKELIERHGVKLKRSGREWKGLCPFPREKTPSFTVYQDGKDDRFHCFGCDADGDVIAFTMKAENIGFVDALERLAAGGGLQPAKRTNGANGAHHAQSDWQPIVPPPADAPRPTDEQLRCDMLHEYYDAFGRLLFFVRRIERKGDKGKQFYPLTFGSVGGQIGWHQKAPPAPRQLYRLDALAANPEAPVLLCEGEKKADAAQRMFPEHVAVAWFGGTGQVQYADLSPLLGFNVTIWPDADPAGAKTAAWLAEQLPDAWMIDTAGLPHQFDAADLERLHEIDPTEWLVQRTLFGVSASVLFADLPEDEAKPDEAETPAPKKRKARTTNILALVTHINDTEAWRGVLKFNLLAETVEVCPPFPPQSGAKEAPRPLADPHDVLLATMHFQANGFPRAGKGVVCDAMNAVAHANSYHPVRDYLAGLTWDGTPRVSTLFQHYFAADLPDDAGERDREVAYLEHISTGFMVGAVARALNPGCKHDHVPVVIGRNQGMLKSSAIRALCHDPSWFSDNIPSDLADRDTKEALRGKWIIELAEIPHIRRETERVKAFFSSQVDRYRAAYGIATQDHPRQCVFIGSSNDLEFVDVTGNRRFWPFAAAGRLDVAAIERDRDQLWAEAVALYRQNVSWWLSPSIERIAGERQDAFTEGDVWDELIARWTRDHPGPFTMAELFERDTGFMPFRDAYAATKADQMRAARSLSRLKFIKSTSTINGVRAKWWWWRRCSQ